MQRFTAQTTTDDIEAVLGRFQAWTGSRGSGASKDGVREISYDEALESSRYRWKGRSAVTALPAAEEDRLREEPGVVPVSTPEPELAPEPRSQPRLQPWPREAIEPEFAAIPPEILESPAPQAAVARAKRVPRRRQHFSTVLAQSVGSAAPGSSLARSWGNGERQVSMSLRVAASEQALIKMRAAEAGVSASSYLRQCALEVEILRGQVQQFLAASGRGRLSRSADSSPAAPPDPRNGWLSQLLRRIWSGKGTILDLKA